jgi:RNA polymerase sigma factor (sigma-70 family)
VFTTITSTTLLQQARDGDEQAWRLIVDRYAPMLRAAIQHAGLHGADGQDVAQEALAVLWDKVTSGAYKKDSGRLKSYLRGILVNKIKEAFHKRAHNEVQVPYASESTGFLNRIPDDRELTDVFDREWELGVLAECLREVQEKVEKQTYEAFDLLVRKEWPVDRVAQHLGITRDAVYTSKSRVLSRLRSIRKEMVKVW